MLFPRRARAASTPRKQLVQRGNQSEKWAADHVEGGCLTSDQGFSPQNDNDCVVATARCHRIIERTRPNGPGAATAIAMVTAQAMPFSPWSSRSLMPLPPCNPVGSGYGRTVGHEGFKSLCCNCCDPFGRDCERRPVKNRACGRNTAVKRITNRGVRTWR